MSEVWKDIAGYEGLYQVSNLGRVRSLDRIDNIRHIHPSRVLKAVESKNGYLYVNLSKLGKARHFFVHRLVAQAFCQSHDESDVVNHIDSDRTNNHADNLEWTTCKGNMQHASSQGRMKGCPENLNAARQALMKPVIAISKDGKRLFFESGAAAGEALGLSSGHIAACCRQEYGYKTIHGYRFEYADAELQANLKPNRVGMSVNELKEHQRKQMLGNKINQGKKYSNERRKRFIAAVGRKVEQLDKKTGQVLHVFDSVTDAERSLHNSGISECVKGRTKTSAGYRWRYLD